MINNRQAGRRNRGRNNGRPNNNRGGGENGNRIDSRARGNAAQLLEKYRNMARDAQLSGDRVNVEYYLQFADHYFRVLADNRARQEEQQQRFRRNDDSVFDDDGDDFGGADDITNAYGQQDREDRGEQQQQYGREDRNDYQRPRNDGEREQGNRRDRDQDRGRDRDRNRPRHDRDFVRQEESAPRNVNPEPQEAPVQAPVAAEPQETAPPRPARGRPRKPKPEPVAEEAIAFDATVLPPAISRADNDSDAPAEEAPRKRTRRARPAAEAAE